MDVNDQLRFQIGMVWFWAEDEIMNIKSFALIAAIAAPLLQSTAVADIIQAPGIPSRDSIVIEAVNVQFTRNVAPNPNYGAVLTNTATPLGGNDNWAKWIFNVERAGRYRLMIRYAMHVSGRAVVVTVNTDRINAHALWEQTGEGAHERDSRWAFVGEVALGEGSNSIEIQTPRGRAIPHIVTIRFDPL